MGHTLCFVLGKAAPKDDGYGGGGGMVSYRYARFRLGESLIVLFLIDWSASV